MNRNLRQQSKVLKEPAGKSVASIDVNGAAVDGDLLAHLQIIGSQIGHAILPHHFLSLQEGALSEARIFHLAMGTMGQPQYRRW